jgi:hypothetical protein
MRKEADMGCAKPSDAIAGVDRAVEEIPLLPETTVREAGMGPALSLREGPGGALVFTLDVTRVIERESLDVSVWGSPDGTDWGAKPVVQFTRRWSCGRQRMVVDHWDQPGVRYLRAEWQVDRWVRGAQRPMFTVDLRVSEGLSRARAAGA